MKKIVLILIALIVYSAVGINQAKFQHNAFNKHPEERTFAEKVVTLHTGYLSGEDKARYIARYEMSQKDNIAFEDLHFTRKALSVSLWLPSYLLLALPYSLALIIYLKWVIFGVIVLAAWSNFGYWLGGYVYDKSINEPNLLTKFLEIPEGKPFDWVMAVNNAEPTKGEVETLYAFLWPFFFVWAIICWIIFSVFKLIDFIWNMIKGIFWLVTAGPARKKSQERFE